MAHLQYFAYKGIGEQYKQAYGYNQAVRVGDCIDCAGQGGWDSESGVISEELEAEIVQAFKNVELNLKDAGGKGWEQVYKVRSYHVPLNEECMGIMVKCFKDFMPTHIPIWTCVGVSKLGRDDMRIEIDVTAHLG